VYQLSKVSLNFFTRQLAVELKGTGVTANAIHPGEVQTEMWSAIKENATMRPESAQNMLSWSKWVEETGGDPPEKTADLVLELLTPTADTLNGQFLWIKEGLKKPMPSW
jgi:3-oxoacyl-[acyl-carrier protein] reductase